MSLSGGFFVPGPACLFSLSSESCFTHRCLIQTAERDELKLWEVTGEDERRARKCRLGSRLSRLPAAQTKIGCEFRSFARHSCCATKSERKRTRFNQTSTLTKLIQERTQKWWGHVALFNPDLLFLLKHNLTSYWSSIWTTNEQSLSKVNIIHGELIRNTQNNTTNIRN